jgi:glycosyltransferase involved in cell wall biosynthesis
MRVLYAIHYPVAGGPHNQALRLAAPLRARGWETIVLLPDESGNAAEKLSAGGVEVVTMSLHRLRASPDPRHHFGLVAALVPEIRAIQRLIRERAVDLVQIGGLVNPHAAIAARLEHIPIVWQLLDTRAPSPVAAVSMLFVRGLADVVMSTGRWVALSHPGGATLKDRLVTYFPPVDVDLFRPRPGERSAVRSEWGIRPESRVVGCVANLNPQKGTTDLVRAFTLVRSRLPDARLVLVGSEYQTHTRYSTEVRALMTAGGLIEGEHVVFTGKRTDIERQLAGFDLFAFAPVPRGEGISTTVLEAMAVGLPVVTTAVAGLPEAINDGTNGRLVAPLDPNGLSRAILELLFDARATARMGEAARSHAVERFSIDKCVDDHLRAYEFALARHGRAAANPKRAE